MKRFLTIIILMAACSCTKQVTVAQPAEQPKDTLALLTAFLDSNAIGTAIADGKWYEVSAIEIDGKQIKHNRMFNPTFYQSFYPEQLGRTFTFYYWDCEADVMGRFTAHVTVYAGGKVFDWKAARMQWKVGASEWTRVGGFNFHWGGSLMPKRIVVKMKETGL